MPNNINQPGFAPEGAKTVNISVTGTSANVQWRTNVNARERHCRIANPSSTVIVFVRFGSDNTVAATTTTDMPILPGKTVILAGSGDWVAAIGSAAGPTVTYFTPGEGNSTTA